MLPQYVHWYYVLTPKWLSVFLWNLELVLLRTFSVGVMFKTLFAHWRRDSVEYGGGIQNILMTLAWNLISRAIGFIIRSLVITVWAVIQVLYIVLVAGIWILYLAWPLLIIFSLAAGIILIFAQ